jgi:hypothetical protein
MWLRNSTVEEKIQQSKTLQETATALKSNRGVFRSVCAKKVIFAHM